VEYDSECFDRTRKEHDAMRSAMQIAKTATGPGSGGKVDALVAQTRAGFFKAMDDDLNTPDALYRLQQFTEGVGEIRGLSSTEGRAIVGLYRECGKVLGLFSDLT